MVITCLVLLCPGEFRTCQLSGCHHGLAVFCSAGSHVHGAGPIGFRGTPGQWWLLGIAVVSVIFNYFLGEEFLFRGVLLPKMQGVFGKYDWVANAVLFSFYHLHKPWTLLTQIVGNLAFSWPARRFRSSWMAIIVHGVEGFLVLAIVLAAILGMGG